MPITFRNKHGEVVKQSSNREVILDEQVILDEDTRLDEAIIVDSGSDLDTERTESDVSEDDSRLDELAEQRKGSNEEQS